MKHLKFLLLFIGLTVLASCSDSDTEGAIAVDNNKALFSGTIGELRTYATDTSWEEGDEIGIYALNAGATLSETAIFDGKSNVKYTTDASGKFSAVGSTIRFPDEGDLDFVAYYPYTAAINEYKYSIDLSQQDNLAAIDLLYSNNAKAKNNKNPNVMLNFDHMLSKLVLNIEAGKDVSSLEGLSVAINNVLIDGSFDLTDGSVAVGTTRKEIAPNVALATDNKTAASNAIVMPNQNLEDVEVVFSLDGKKYIWNPTNQELNATFKYEYTIILSLTDTGDPRVELEKVGATITDWGDAETGDADIDLDPIDIEQVTVDELLAKYEAEGSDEWTITNLLALKAVVTSDRIGGNSTSPSNGYLQDEAGSAIAFRVTEQEHTFDMGDELIIDLKGATLSKYGGSTQLGLSLEQAKVNAADVVITPKEMTIAEIFDGYYDGLLVKIKDVQFEEYADLTYYSSDDKSITKHALVDSRGASIDLGTTQHASFKDESLPKGNGDIVGILSVYWGNWQINARNLDDIALSDDESTRFEPPVLETDSKSTIIEKEGGNYTINVTSNIEWTATSDADWLSLEPASSQNDGAATITVAENSEEGARLAEVVISAPDYEALAPIVVTIAQKGINDGSEENPYTVADAIIIQGEKDVWVKGFIVGYMQSNRHFFEAGFGASGTNIMLADSADETDGANVVPVQLPQNKVRTALNLIDNPEKLKTEVVIKGNLEAYFSQPGLRGAKEYK